MKSVSGTTMVTCLNSAFRLSGRGVRPKLKGFIVMNKPQDGLKGRTLSSMQMVVASYSLADESAMINCEMMASTWISKRLNSSKQTQVPLAAKPLKNLDIEV